jgi:hypothetical protein
MKSLLFFLYISCYGCYVLFARDPDYFDSEIEPAIIHWKTDKQGKIPEAVYNVDGKNYAIDASYILRDLTEGRKLAVIVNMSKPTNASIYSIWGYWLKWGELLVSITLLLVLFYVAYVLNINPVPEAVLEQMEELPVKKKYLED